MKLLLVLAMLASTASHAATVDKKTWVTSMETALANLLCKKGAYFRECYSSTENECLEEGMRATKTCLIKMDSQFPAQFNQPKDGTFWGEKVGACTGTNLETALIAAKKKITTNPKCNDPKAWM